MLLYTCNVTKDHIVIVTASFSALFTLVVRIKTLINLDFHPEVGVQCAHENTKEELHIYSTTMVTVNNLNLSVSDYVYTKLYGSWYIIV